MGATSATKNGSENGEGPRVNHEKGEGCSDVGIRVCDRARHRYPQGRHQQSVPSARPKTLKVRAVRGRIKRKRTVHTISFKDKVSTT